MAKRKRKRTKKRKIIPEERYITKDVRRRVRKRDENKCVYCNKRDRSFQMDGLKLKRVKLEYGHQIPHSFGGNRCINNIQMECKRCNRRKGASMKKTSWVMKMMGRGAKGCERKNCKCK